MLALGVLLLAACSTSGPKSNDPALAEAAEVNLGLAQGYIQRGEYEIALDRLRKAESLAPRSAEVQTMLGYLHERIRRPEVAERHYRRSIELAPESGAILNNYGGWLCRVGRPKEADAWFRKALDDPFYRTPEAALANAGRCALQARDMQAAEGHFRRALEFDPDNTMVLESLAMVSLELGRALNARAFLQRREGLPDVGPGLLELGARIERALGDTAAADRYLERLNRDFPEYRPSTPDSQSRP